MTKQFEQAAEAMKLLGEIQLVSNETKLELYGHFKQATVGSNKSPQPSWWNQVERYKWDAWYSLKDMTTEQAKQRYISIAVEQLKRYQANNPVLKDLLESITNEDDVISLEECNEIASKVPISLNECQENDLLSKELAELKKKLHLLHTRLEKLEKRDKFYSVAFGLLTIFSIVMSRRSRF